MRTNSVSNVNFCGGKQKPIADVDKVLRASLGLPENMPKGMLKRLVKKATTKNPSSKFSVTA